MVQKLLKKSTKNARVVAENNVASFFPDTVYKKLTRKNKNGINITNFTMQMSKT